MKYRIEYSTTFKRSYKRAQKCGLPMNELNDAVRTLAEGRKLAAKYRDHALTGQYKSCRECHIHPDWLLIYRIQEQLEILDLIDTGTHADIFKM